MCCGLMVLLTSADDALGQASPGYRMRPPTGSLLRPPNVSARPPRLIGIPDGSSNVVQGFGRRLVVPSRYFGLYPFDAYGYGYPDDSVSNYSADNAPVRNVDPANYSTEVKPARNVQTLDDSAAVGKLQVTEETDDSKNAVRLTWRDTGVGATQVAFFLADSTRAVLAAETVRTPPFTWLFELQPRTTFAGMTAVLPGGSLVTQYVAVRR